MAMGNLCDSGLISKINKILYCPEIISVMSTYNQSTVSDAMICTDSVVFQVQHCISPRITCQGPAYTKQY